MIRLEWNGKSYSAFLNDQCMGEVELYDNPCHARNCYLRVRLEYLERSVSAELFDALAQLVKRPMQVMVDSGNVELAGFLIAGGFSCRRKCYEVEAGVKDYTGQKIHFPLVHTHRGEPDYERCCGLMYDCYVANHEMVNPWTADFETFCRDMPAEAVCEKSGSEILNLAFVEENEIAYVCGCDGQEFARFASGLVTWLFERYETVCFESDDCDWAAMELKAMFANQAETSFDTYVYDGGHGH